MKKFFPLSIHEQITILLKILWEMDIELIADSQRKNWIDAWSSDFNRWGLLFLVNSIRFVWTNEKCRWVIWRYFSFIFFTMDVRQRVRTEENESSSESEHEIIENPSPIVNQSDWRKDRWNISLLLFLYLLQGIPLGMAASIPLIIQTYGASWSQQATFSFAFWPFSLKLLWAPIVDALYMKRFGRRKSWLIPVQYALGFVMILLSYYIKDLLEDPTPTPNNHHPRTGEFLWESMGKVLFLYFRNLFFNIDLFWIVILSCNTGYLCWWLGTVNPFTVEKHVRSKILLIIVDF